MSTTPTLTLLIASIAALAPIASIAQPSEGSKYARCAGSYELEKCRAQVDAALKETPEAKRARIEKLERERLAAAEAVIRRPTAASQLPAQSVSADPTIGMTAHEAMTSTWGQPETKNRTVTKYGSREQWVYGEGRYLYLEDGRVTAISSRQ